MALLVIFLAALCYALSFLITAGIIALICWAFALTFTWKLAFGIWLVLILIRGIFSVTVKNG